MPLSCAVMPWSIAYWASAGTARPQAVTTSISMTVVIARQRYGRK